MEIDIIKIAEGLVRERIKGSRKGLDSPNYVHSFRVRDLVGASPADVSLAALLHDIVEDGGTSFEELKSLGFSDRVIKLVDLCSHSPDIENGTSRWVLMIARLVSANDEDAWRIKLADLADNLTESAGLKIENRVFMIEVKAPLMLRLTEEFPALSDLRETLRNEMLNQKI